MRVNVGLMNKPVKNILYVTYDGLTDPLGRSQILPYLQGLAALGHHITILSCEKRDRFARDAEAIRRICDEAGIAWQPLRYHKKPPLLSSMYDVAMLKRMAVKLHRRTPFSIVHCRSYIAAMVGLHMKERFGVKLLFDMRGFWPDERVDGNSWSLSHPVYKRVYAHFKKLEARLLESADHIISLTHEGKRQLLTRPQFQPSGPPITVIPCCVDFSHFPLQTDEARQAGRILLSIPQDVRVVAYLGSLGTWYMLDEMLDFFCRYARQYPDARLLFITPDAPEPIIAEAGRKGIDPKNLVIRSASRDQVPEMMAAADVGLFFIRPVFSKKASSPTKMAEILALGLPVVTNGGVGDVSEIVDDTECGIAIETFDDESYDRAIAAIAAFSVDPEELRRRALALFDVQLGIAGYDAVYRSLC